MQCKINGSFVVYLFLNFYDYILVSQFHCLSLLATRLCFASLCGHSSTIYVDIIELYCLHTLWLIYTKRATNSTV